MRDAGVARAGERAAPMTPAGTALPSTAHRGPAGRGGARVILPGDDRPGMACYADPNLGGSAMHVLAAASAALVLASAQDPAPSAAWSDPPAEPAAAPREAVPPPAARPDLSPRFVATVGDLTPLAADPLVRGRVESLQGRRTGGVLCLV